MMDTNKVYSSWKLSSVKPHDLRHNFDDMNDKLINSACSKFRKILSEEFKGSFKKYKKKLKKEKKQYSKTGDFGKILKLNYTYGFDISENCR